MGKYLLRLRLPRFDAQFSNVELAAAQPVRPAEECVLFPAHLEDHQVTNIHISSDEERQRGVSIQHWPAGRCEGVKGSSFQTALILRWK